MRWLAVVVALAALHPLATAQDPGDLSKVIDRTIGEAGATVLPIVYNATGQNITREDVRIYLDLNFSKGQVDLFGLLVGSGTAEVQVDAHLRVEMRVISSDRIRAALEDENAYNISSENATAFSEVYLTSEMFRATLTGEAISMFKDAQADALRDYLEASVPELDVLGLDVTWHNTTPLQTLRDLSLTEPPIVVEIDATLQYLRTESLASLVGAYLDAKAAPEDPKKAYIQDLKRDHGAPLHERDFFAAAAYTQLLNLSMQPGWALEITMRVPRGYSFTYVNEEVDASDDRTVRFGADAMESDEPVQSVVLASITHKRAVAMALFVATVAVGLLIALPARFFYARRRVPKLADRGIGASKR